MYESLFANCSASKGAVQRWVTIKIFSILLKFFPSLPVLLPQHMLQALVYTLLCSANKYEQAVPSSAVALGPHCLCIRYCKADVTHCMLHKLQHKANSASTTFAPCCCLHLPLCCAHKCEEAVLSIAFALCLRCLCIRYCKADGTHCRFHKLQRRASKHHRM